MSALCDGEQYSYNKAAYEVFADLYAPVPTLLYAFHSFGSEGKTLLYSGTIQYYP